MKIDALIVILSLGLLALGIYGCLVLREAPAWLSFLVPLILVVVVGCLLSCLFPRNPPRG
jgi:uncharacterized protein (DUF983 family)